MFKHFKELNELKPDSEEHINLLKKKEEEVRKMLLGFKSKWWHWLIAAFIGWYISFVYTLREGNFDSFEKFIKSDSPLIMLLLIVVGIAFYALLLFAWRLQYKMLLKSIELKLIKLDTEKLKENIEENFFTKLVQINFKYIDQYYLQTQEQAEKSFRLSSFAAIAGLLIVTVGIVMMFFAKTEPAYVTTAAGVISEFIAAVFFYLYNRTILKMSEYHQKLVLTQNISLALKITEDMSEDSKSKVQEMLVDRLTQDTNKYLAGYNSKE